VKRGGAGRTLGWLAFVVAAGALLAEAVAPVTVVELVTPIQLARWIREARSGLEVIDTREPEQYAAGHIPTARNVPATRFDGVPAIGHSTVVLYDESGLAATRLAGEVSPDGSVEVYVLERGMDGWLDDVMAPRLPDTATAAERAAFAEQAELSRWFGGLPRIVAVEPVAGHAAESSPARSKRLLGGC
jgi:rhodanese-related sulfurtransferase